MTKANENRLQIAIDYMEGLPDENHSRLTSKASGTLRWQLGLSLSEKPMAIRGESQQRFTSQQRTGC